MRYDKLLYFCIITLFLFLTSCSSPEKKEATNHSNINGYADDQHQFWKGKLQIKEHLQLPFLLQSDSKHQFKIINDKETIRLQHERKGDSLLLHFPAYSNYLIIEQTQQKLKGYFVQPDRSEHRRIPFTAVRINDSAIWNQSDKSNKKIEGQWKTTFKIGTTNTYAAIGTFQQSKNGKITGTFMTETGDYRFLQGAFSNDSLFMSTFDGAHAFLFTATFNNDTLSGRFYSGSHWKTDWIAMKSDSEMLRDPKELTYMTNDQMSLSFLTTDSSTFKYPADSLKNHVIIFQILGTWCPNCLDETQFYKELYTDYHEQGLEIIGIAYENPTSFHHQVERIERFRMNKSVPYPIFVGGEASKQVASNDFDMLNTISSFPTSIFIDRSGNVVRIHTGFNGPGTGKVYEKYTKETRHFIESLLRE